MIVLPENPEKDFLYIFDGFYKAILLLKWFPTFLILFI